MDENEKNAAVAMVVAYYEKHGFELVMTNWECVDGGFDIVMTRDDEISFIDICEPGDGDEYTVERVRAAASRFKMYVHLDCDAQYDIASFSDSGNGVTLYINFDCVDLKQDSLEKLRDDMFDAYMNGIVCGYNAKAWSQRLDAIINNR